MITLSLASVLVLAPLNVDDQIRVRYVAWDKSYFAHDVNRLAGMLHADFSLVTDHGNVVSRKEYIARLWKSDLPDFYETTLLKTKVTGDTATAWTLEKSKEAGNPLSEHRYEDTWRFADGRWMLLKSITRGEK